MRIPKSLLTAAAQEMPDTVAGSRHVYDQNAVNEVAGSAAADVPSEVNDALSEHSAVEQSNRVAREAWGYKSKDDAPVALPVVRSVAEQQADAEQRKGNVTPANITDDERQALAKRLGEFQNWKKTGQLGGGTAVAQAEVDAWMKE